MKISVEEFIEAKFGRIRDVTFKTEPYHTMDDGSSGDLVDLLREFKNVLSADNIGQSRNPRTEEWTVVDKDKGMIIGHFKNPIIE